MVQNAPKPRGRPRSFDEAEALEKATQVYWSKGYDGVTIDDLVAGMGVGRPSLYAVFGDKRTLFLRVLKDYAEKKGARAAKALLSPQQRAWLAGVSARYCPLEERFFPSLDALHAHAVEEHALLAWRDDGGPVALPRVQAFMLVTVTRNEITEQIVVARLAKGLTWQELADAIDRPVVWTTAALLGQR